MPLVTMYEDVFNGEEIASKVAESLGFRCVGRSTLVEAVQQYGVPEAKLHEIMQRGQHWWDVWLQHLRPYRIALQAAMCDLAKDGKLVYHGHIGHELLPGVSHVLRVVLTAPMDFRIDYVSVTQNLDREHARHFIEQVDSARSRRLMVLFGRDWRDAESYDLVVNLKMGTAAIVSTITHVAQLEVFAETPESRVTFDNVSLANRAQTVLLRSRAFGDLMVDVSADKGEIIVSGWRPRSISEAQMMDLLKAVPGVTRVTNNTMETPRATWEGAVD